MRSSDVFYWIVLSLDYFFILFIVVLILYKFFQAALWCISRFRYRERFPRLKIRAYLSYYKNSKHFLKIFSELIEKYENEAQNDYFSLAPSCKEEMVKLMKYRLSAARIEVSEWKDSETDYIKIVHAHLSITSFDLLASGKFHIYTGTLNPMSCAFNLKRIHAKVIEYALENGYITKEEASEDAEALRQSISEVG